MSTIVFIFVVSKQPQMKTQIKLVVLNEHTLGYVWPSELDLPGFYSVGILSASILKGANKVEGSVPFTEGVDKIRLASEKDFDNFRHSFEGYANDKVYEYIYAK